MRPGGLVVLACLAASVFPARPAKGQDGRIEFDHVSIGQGLSQSDVNCMLEDKAGFIWFGTQDGLNRYDGYAFRVYRHSPSDSTTISDNYITALYEDPQGALWIGTQHGLNLFDSRTETFRTFTRGPGSNFISSICPGTEGGLLVGTYGGGLTGVESRSFRFFPVEFDPRTSNRDTVLALCRGRDGRVWIGTRGRGLFGLDPAGGATLRLHHDPSDRTSLSNNSVQCLFGDSRGNLWVGTAFGLNRLDPGTGKFQRYLFGVHSRNIYSNYIFCVYEDRSGTLWAGTDEGLQRYDPVADAFHRAGGPPGDPGSLSDEAVMSIADAGGVVWFGTKRGLNKYCRYGKQFRNYTHIPYRENSLSDNKVWSMLCGRNGMLWVGSNGGLDGIDRHSGKWVHYRHDPSNLRSLGNNSVMALLGEPSGALWLGTWGGGLNRFDMRTGTFRRFLRPAPDSLYSGRNTVVALCRAANGMIWLATYGGAAVFDPAKERYLAQDELPAPSARVWSEAVQEIEEDREGRIWFGTYEGLTELDQKTGRSVTFHSVRGDSAGLCDDRILSILPGRDRKLYIGTEGGLNVLDPETMSWSRFTCADGLANDLVCGVLEDATGSLWISTNRGIAMVNPQTRAVKNFDIADGLQGNEFNEWASYRSPAGEMFFGGMDGLTSFYPESLRENRHIPPVVVTYLKIKDREKLPAVWYSRADPVRLDYEDNGISFEFAALDYTRPEKNRYAYKLDGFDNDWVYSGSRRYGSYTNIEPGEYSLRLKGSNNDGVWSEEEAVFRFIIEPPFRRTWWFRSAAVLTLVAAAAAGYRARMSTVRRRNEMLEMKIEERTRELAHTNESLLKEVLERNRAQQELWELKERLEEQVRERTEELSSTISSLKRQIAARELAERNLIAYQEKLRLLASDLSTTEERERRRLSAYLHDSIAQTLAFCKIKLGSVQRTARLKGSDARLRDVLGMIEQSITETRRLTLELSPPILHELGLAAAVDWLCSRMRERHQIEIRLEDSSHQPVLDADLSILLFHAVREAIVNVVKHAGAGRASIRIRRDHSRVSVEVEDDGCGFDSSLLHDHAGGHDGFGLFHIRERLHSLGGSLEVDSSPGRGTRVVMNVPASHDAVPAAGREG